MNYRYYIEITKNSLFDRNDPRYTASLYNDRAYLVECAFAKTINEVFVELVYEIGQRSKLINLKNVDPEIIYKI